mmetsp:Transcript_11472/g.25199  ORF Transcript_11472/g.25199 Transcript_11472/m.25199 type:complete len:848 (+) Transcript_11472:701-3244(+)
MEGYKICNYDAICPLGPNSEPLVGYKDNENGSWAPIANDSNDWVNLSSDSACIRYTHEHPDHPEWGMTGEGNEEITRNIMCCKGSLLGSAKESFLYKVASETYHPVWFDRTNGWTGQTYQQALEFCQQRNEKTSLCPYHAVCPMTELNVPSGGVIDEPNGSWAPISDYPNGWVQVGAENICMFYQVLNEKAPEWGITGVDNEDITRHIMCCETAGAGAADEGKHHVAGTFNPSENPTPSPFHAPTSSPAKKSTPPPTPLPSDEPTPAPTPLPSQKPTLVPFIMAVATATEATMVTDAYSSVLKYNPVWHSRSSGWKGQTYDEAFEYCSKQGPGYDLCPYSVYCPGGNGSEPYGGMMEEPSWAAINDSFNEWVRVSSDNPCVHFTTINSSHPGWGLTGEDNEDITRHIMCCQTYYLEGDTSEVPKEIIGKMDHDDVKEFYNPTWYHRDEISPDGWVGKSYTDALAFCSQRDSSIPCPYEAYCPHGELQDIQGPRIEAREAWAPIMNIPNGWVNVGSSFDSCELYNSIHSHPPFWGLIGRHSKEELDMGEDEDVKDLTAHLMCCREPGDKPTALRTTVSSPIPAANTSYEQDILDKKHPIWFTRKHGYHGTTHEDAAAFCKGVGDMVLCPRETYCPEGSEEDKPLFLQKDAFEGEQWAPVATTDTRSSHRWILVGMLGGESQSTCATFGDVKGMKPGWNVDDSSSPELKENVLCCLNPNRLLKELNYAKKLGRIWLDESFGWKGGSHTDAEELCNKLGNRKLCPYTAYCPHGPGQPAIGGHMKDFNMEGEQWAPVYHTEQPNYWVMIGRKYQNSATTCMDMWELEGSEPSWGLSNERADLKKNIMCCSF